MRKETGTQTDHVQDKEKKKNIAKENKSNRISWEEVDNETKDHTL